MFCYIYMFMRSFHSIRLFLGTLLIGVAFTSCEFDNLEAGNGPIVLGDPATIVTEEDAQYLEDFVNDLKDELPDTIPAVIEEKDTLNNVAQAQQLEKQQEQESMNAHK